MHEYSFILIYIFICLLISLIVMLLSYIMVYQRSDDEKNSAYECGFNPFGDARSKFDIKFYLVAIFFIIFDLEITFLFPWTITLHAVDLFGYYSMFVFLLILTLGFVYEWIVGALNWYNDFPRIDL